MLLNRGYITKLFFFISFLFLSTHSAQTGKIVGIVTDASNGKPLVGANVFIENTSIGCATDTEGNFIIRCPWRLSSPGPG